MIFLTEERLSQSELQNIMSKNGSAKGQLDHMNNHMICKRGKPAIVRSPLQQLLLDSSESAEQLDSGWFGERC